MPSGNSIWDMSALKAMVADWYGLLPHKMPMRVVTREEEIEAFEAEHTEVPYELWELVNHSIRQTRMWAKHDWIDVVIWNEPSQSFKLVQDVCFKDEFESEVEWHKAVLEILKDPSKKVWIVFHE